MRYIVKPGNRAHSWRKAFDIVETIREIENFPSTTIAIIKADVSVHIENSLIKKN
jgi:hypothetical protein